MQINWVLKKFEELSVSELYAIIELRNEVFVVEQNCVYQDADNIDQLSYHLSGYMNGNLIAYARLIPPSIAYKEMSIGRVVSKASYRKLGIGKKLVEVAIEEMYSLFAVQPIKIGAQYYLLHFYQLLGFKEIGDVYLLDGIDHIEMIK